MTRGTWGGQRCGLELRTEGKERREYEAVDRASNSKGLLTRARSEAGRGPACMPRWRRARERETEHGEVHGEENGGERRANHYTRKLPTPPEFRNSGAQTRPCPANHESFNLFHVGRNCSNRRGSKRFIRYPRLFRIANSRNNLSSLYLSNMNTFLSLTTSEY